MFSEFSLLNKVTDDYSKNVNQNSNEDKLMKIKPKSTENLSLHSDGKVLTTLDNRSTEPAK